LFFKWRLQANAQRLRVPLLLHCGNKYRKPGKSGWLGRSRALSGLFGHTLPDFPGFAGLFGNHGIQPGALTARLIARGAPVPTQPCAWWWCGADGGGGDWGGGGGVPGLLKRAFYTKGRTGGGPRCVGFRAACANQAACANPRAGCGAARPQGNGASTRGRSLAGRKSCVVEKLCGRINSRRTRPLRPRPPASGSQAILDSPDRAVHYRPGWRNGPPHALLPVARPLYLRFGG
jgi:hypothetical protein